MPLSDFSEYRTDSIDSPIVFFDCVAEMIWRPRRRNIPGTPPGAFDLPQISSDVLGAKSDSFDSVIFFDGPVEMTWRPRQRDIPGMPPDAYDLPPTPEKPKKEPEDGPKDAP